MRLQRLISYVEPLEITKYGHIVELLSLSHAQFAVSQVALKAKHRRFAENDGNRNSTDIESTELSQIDGNTQSPEAPYVRPLALNAKGVGNAFKAQHWQAAGSAWQHKARILMTVAALLLGFTAIAVECEFKCTIAVETVVEMRVKAQVNTIRICGGGVTSKVMSHAQFAVSQVALKAKHRQAAENDGNRNSTDIESTELSQIDGNTQSPEAL